VTTDQRVVAKQEILAFEESNGAWSPWQRTIYIVTALGLNRSAHRRSERG
jgi:hypothetical protein